MLSTVRRAPHVYFPKENGLTTPLPLSSEQEGMDIGVRGLSVAVVP